MNVKLTPQCGGVFWFRDYFFFFAVVVLLGVFSFWVLFLQIGIEVRHTVF